MDVFVLPSRDEGFGLVFLEAMAVGVPVVGTRVIGSEDAVEDGVTGLLVPYADAPALGQGRQAPPRRCGARLPPPGHRGRARATLYSREQFAAQVGGASTAG